MASGTAQRSMDRNGAATRDGRNDFDFLFGRWRVGHRKLRDRLVGDTRWDAFDGASDVRPILGGLGNVDDNLIGAPEHPYRAASVRQFDPVRQLWTIWWFDERIAELAPPVHGRFEAGVGAFFGDDLLRGQPIRVRYLWSEITQTSARWEQAFSADGETSWETNWIMQFERVG